MPEWMQLGGGLVSLSLAVISVFARLTGRPGVMATSGRFLRWCVSRPAREIDLIACRELNRAYEEWLGIRRSVREMRSHESAAGNDSRSGSGGSKEGVSLTWQTTPTSLLPLVQKEPES
jgi:hypothetical protein